jgi:transposase
MSLPLVPDDLWEAIEPLLPKEPPKPRGGRPRVPDRAALTGIIFVLRTGMPWRFLPQELGCGSGSTCWRRLRDWQAAGVWERLHAVLLNWLGDSGVIDWSRPGRVCRNLPQVCPVEPERLSCALSNHPVCPQLELMHGPDEPCWRGRHGIRG